MYRLRPFIISRIQYLTRTTDQCHADDGGGDEPDFAQLGAFAEIVDADAKQPGHDGTERRGGDHQNQPGDQQLRVRLVVGNETPQGGRGWHVACHSNEFYGTRLSY